MAHVRGKVHAVERIESRTATLAGQRRLLVAALGVDQPRIRRRPVEHAVPVRLDLAHEIADASVHLDPVGAARIVDRSRTAREVQRFARRRIDLQHIVDRHDPAFGALRVDQLPGAVGAHRHRSRTPEGVVGRAARIGIHDPVAVVELRDPRVGAEQRHHHPDAVHRKALQLLRLALLLRLGQEHAQTNRRIRRQQGHLRLISGAGIDIQPRRHGTEFRRTVGRLQATGQHRGRSRHPQ